MANDPETNSLVPVDFSNISDRMPELKMFDYQVTTISFSPLVDSSEMNPTIWKQLVLIIEENYSTYDGFVILHGTDTMSYTASALSFMLHNLQKPVILTGSQLPLGTVRTDGKENLITALEIASAQRNSQALVPEVCIYFQSKLFRGNRTTKYNAENFHAFRSDNHPPLAEVGIHLKYNYPYIRYTTLSGTFGVSTEMESNVALLKIFPGIGQGFVEAVLNTPGLRGLVLETFGSGNAPTSKWFLYALQKAIDRGVIIINVTQCLAGSVEMWRYETGVHMLDMGLVSGYDITTEAALTKLMYLLGNYDDVAEIKNLLNKSLKGEISV